MLAGGCLVRPPLVHRRRPLALSSRLLGVSSGRAGALRSLLPPRSLSPSRGLHPGPCLTPSHPKAIPPAMGSARSREKRRAMLAVWFLAGSGGGPLVTCCAMSIATTLSAERRLPKPIDGREVQREGAIFMVRAHGNGVSGLAGGLGAISATGAATHRRGRAGAAVSRGTHRITTSPPARDLLGPPSEFPPALHSTCPGDQGTQPSV